ncbi:MAG TPA: hypothetical protein PLH22_03095 [Candidatus Colwellbacteria bacterium]|nr:hypothetical protein [Candidatus Colwellbacteria bacterium]
MKAVAADDAWGSLSLSAEAEKYKKMSFIALIHLTGSVLGAVMAVFNYRQSRTLIGSFFPKYYQLTVLASTLLAIGFAGKCFVLDKPGSVADGLVQFILLAAAGVYASAIIVWPKEANRYLSCKL